MPASPDENANTEVHIAKISSKSMIPGENSTIDILQMSQKFLSRPVSDSFSNEQVMDQEINPSFCI